MIRYGTLLEIEKECRKNRRNAKLMVDQIPDIKLEISALESQKMPFAHYQQLDQKINQQDQQIKAGQSYIINQEEFVHSVITEGEQEWATYEKEIRGLNTVLEQMTDTLHQIDCEAQLKAREWLKKIEFEQTLVDRCKEFMEAQQQILADERKKVVQRTQIRRVSEDVMKLRLELEKVTRD